MSKKIFRVEVTVDELTDLMNQRLQMSRRTPSPPPRVYVSPIQRVFLSPARSVVLPAPAVCYVAPSRYIPVYEAGYIYGSDDYIMDTVRIGGDGPIENKMVYVTSTSDKRGAAHLDRNCHFATDRISWGRARDQGRTICQRCKASWKKTH